MTPKEKAEELVDKYIYKQVMCYGSADFDLIKEFALIAVEEILDIDCYDMSEEPFNNHIEYWQEVKNEIEKL